MCLFLGLAGAAQGQEAVRMSVASSEAAQARRQAATTVGYYNLKLGPTAWNFGAGLGVDYNSNVQNTEVGPQGDFILRPQINTRMVWPLSDKNTINLALGAGYSAYVNTPTLNRMFITPGSELSFDFYVGEFWINLHDRFSISENSYQDPTVAGSGSYAQFENSLGLTTTWDLNKTVLRVGYDHVIYDSLSGGNNQSIGGQSSGYSEVFSASAGYNLKPGMLVGVELGDSLFTYTTFSSYTPYSSANQWNLGGFYDTPVSEYIHFTAHAGYTVYSPKASTMIDANYDFSGYYAALDVRHRVNQYLEYSLSAGRSLSVAFSGGNIDRYFARWQASWLILRKLTLGTTFSYEYGTQVGIYGETYEQYGPGISLSRPITAKLSSSVGYQLYWRNSDQAGRNYTVNVISLNLNYAF